MARISRTKLVVSPGVTPGVTPGVADVAARVHFAVAVAPQGNVTQWTEVESEATDFPPEVARQVADYYEGRPHAGRLAFSDRPGGASGAEVDEAAIAHAERLGEENEELRKALDEAKANASDLIAMYKEDRKELAGEIETLKKENARLTGELAAAQELLNAKE